MSIIGDEGVQSSWPALVRPALRTVWTSFLILVSLVRRSTLLPIVPHVQATSSSTVPRGIRMRGASKKVSTGYRLYPLIHPYYCDEFNSVQHTKYWILVVNLACMGNRNTSQSRFPSGREPQRACVRSQHHYHCITLCPFWND